MKKLLTIALLLIGGVGIAAAKELTPVDELVERIQPGQSKRFIFELTDQQATEDFFELDSQGSKIVVRGNNYISIAAGLNWYLKYYAGIHISWNDPKPRLSHFKFPKPKTAERHSTDMLIRYYLNFCTFSYSTPFWDWKRWEQEIDWMALHGINLPLSLTGAATVWRNTLIELGVSKEAINQFIPGPAHQAWWLMNNMEEWGGPNPESWYRDQAELERKIVARYREWGIEPVFAGYAGMVPSAPEIQEQMGIRGEVKDPGEWCGFQRPGFLQPTHPKFQTIAETYYRELEKLYGTGNYFAIDPFHEGGSTQGVDLGAAGLAIYESMKKANPAAVWVLMAWQENPRIEMIRDLPGGDLLILDLWSESRPMWGDRQSPWFREEGYGRHDWIYCMLLNFGGNVGMHGKMQRVINSYYEAREAKPNGQFLKGVGTTSEGIETNPVMYELLYELPWRTEKFEKDDWVKDYVKARYWQASSDALEAWKTLSNTVYSAPYGASQEGTTESVFCARPALKVNRVSSWGSSKLNYDPKETQEALRLMLRTADKYKGCDNFEYDLVDVARQALADRGNILLQQIEKSADDGKPEEFEQLSGRFLELILLQDSLLNSRKEFMLGPWIESSMRMGQYADEKDFFRWNARTLITTWGSRHAANIGGLRDYAHREWGGMLKDFYYPRWKVFFDALKAGELPPQDYYSMEAGWTVETQPYPIHAETDPVNMAWKVYERLLTF